MIELCHLSSGYPGKPVLSDFTCSIPSGQLTAILGPNGCGKSTLLKTICGILPPTGGTITLDGEDLAFLPSTQRAKCLSYLPQSSPIPHMTVERMVLQGRFPHLSYPRRYRQQDYAIAHKAMAQMGIDDLAQTLVGQLSGGQRQRVYLAMALAQESPWMLLDEPTTFLDIGSQLELLSFAQTLCTQGKTPVFVLHDLSLALSTCQNLILMNQGFLVATGTPQEVFASGQLDEIFGVRVRQVADGETWRYFCDIPSQSRHFPISPCNFPSGDV